MPIDALIFDLDNTLWDVGPVIVRAEQMLADFLAEAYPRVLERHTLASMRELRSRLMLEEPAMLHDFTWLRLEMLRRLAREADYPESMAQHAFDVFYRARNEVVLYDDVLPALTALRPRWRLFAISNGNADLAAIGLAEFFERSLSARDAGCLKPDPRIFRRLIDEAGLEAARVLHVGDDPDADIAGASAVGMKTIHVVEHRHADNECELPRCGGVHARRLEQVPQIANRLVPLRFERHVF